MCASARYKGKWADSQYELAKLIGKKNVVISPGYEMGFMGKHCLCPVDFEATAAKIGCRAEYDGCMHHDLIPIHPDQ